MAEFFAYLQSILKLSAKQGFIWLLCGGAILGLHHIKAPIFSEFESGWLRAAAAAALFGAVIIVVSVLSTCGSWISNGFGKIRSEREKRRQREEDDLSAMQNLHLLHREDAEVLAWVLRSGNQRFRAPARFMWATLSPRNIALQDERASDGQIWMIRDNVWARREELLDSLKNVETEDAPPWRRW